MATLRVITLRLDEPARVEEISAAEDGLKGLQAIVGGYIERVPGGYWQRRPGLSLWCNENGIAEQLPTQIRAEIGQHLPLIGNLVLTGMGEDGSTLSVTDEDVARYVTASYCTRCGRHHERTGDAEERCQEGMRFADADHRRRGGTV